MKLVYTIINGQVKCSDFTKDIPFALVFIQDGVYKIETFFSDDSFFDKNYYSRYYTLIGKTEKSFDIEIHGMLCSNVSSVNNKTIFTCDGFVKLIDNRNMANADLSEIKNKKDKIFLIEIEGLKTQFANCSEYEGYVHGNSQKISFNYGFDHTSCGMILNMEGFQGNWFHLVFHKSPENENIILDFTQSNGYCELYYENYLQFKDDLLSFLSFINGNKVQIRRELTGYFLSNTIDGFDSQTVYIYSQNTLSNTDYSDYVPINKHHSYSSVIFRDLFVHCFDKFCLLNKQFDFEALIFSINNSIQTAGLNERYYILITALEKIANENRKLTKKDSQLLYDANKFESIIKPRLIQTIKDFKSELKINDQVTYSFISKIGNLNNKEKTKSKIEELFNYAKIPLNDKVLKLINKERDVATHEGIVMGDTIEEKFKNYWKLDHILRDIILNLIGYKSYRKRKFDYLN